MPPKKTRPRKTAAEREEEERRARARDQAPSPSSEGLFVTEDEHEWPSAASSPAPEAPSVPPASEEGPDTTSPANQPAANPRDGTYTCRPLDPADRSRNGRVQGRSLITWGRPRMVEKLVLHMQYELEQRGTSIPWDRIAHRLHPGSSGNAVQQYLIRTRNQLIAEGHLVPPIPGSEYDPEVRGFARRDPGPQGDLLETRPVRFDERFPDAQTSLPDAVNLKSRRSAKRRATAEGGGDAPAAPQSTHSRPERKRQRQDPVDKPEESAGDEERAQPNRQETRQHQPLRQTGGTVQQRPNSYHNDDNDSGPPREDIGDGRYGQVPPPQHQGYRGPYQPRPLPNVSGNWAALHQPHPYDPYGQSEAGYGGYPMVGFRYTARPPAPSPFDYPPPAFGPAGPPLPPPAGAPFLGPGYGAPIHPGYGYPGHLPAPGPPPPHGYGSPDIRAHGPARHPSDSPSIYGYPGQASHPATPDHPPQRRPGHSWHTPPGQIIDHTGPQVPRPNAGYPPLDHSRIGSRSHFPAARTPSSTRTRPSRGASVSGEALFDGGQEVGDEDEDVDTKNVLGD